MEEIHGDFSICKVKAGLHSREISQTDGKRMQAKWQRCNDVIMSWLISSVSDDIVGQILHAKDVMIAWNILHAWFAGTNLARKSGLIKEANNLVQDSIKKISPCPSDGNCGCCQEASDEKMEDREVQYLMGLNECYSTIRTHVFAMSKVSDMVIVFEMATREECQSNATKATYVEASALCGQHIRSTYQSGQGNYQNAPNNNTYQGSQANES
ncbi:hypothetical protein QQ045_012136 [Rhodiola kirilowii]